MSKRKYNKTGEYSKKHTPSLKLHLGVETKRSISVVVLLIVSVVSALGMLGIAGNLGDGLTTLILSLFGVTGYLLPIFLALLAYLMLAIKKEALVEQHAVTGRVFFGGALVWLGVEGFLHLILFNYSEAFWSSASLGQGGGIVGAAVSYIFIKLMGVWAAGFVLSGVLVIGFLIMGNWKLSWPSRSQSLQPAFPTISIPSQPSVPSLDFTQAKLKVGQTSLQTISHDKHKESLVGEKTITGSKQNLDSIVTTAHSFDASDWQLPPFDLLDPAGGDPDSGNLEAGAAIIQQTLRNFGLEVEMGETSVGPTVTQYTFRPATGIKLSQVGALKADLALALAAKSLRMELPIPGKALVGVEVPNRTVAVVRLRSVLESSEFINHKSNLIFSLGQDVAGLAQVADLSKLPHLLIAGATNSGKSVAINTLLISLLYRNSPRTAKLILIDPKRVELTLYQGLPHLLTAPITRPDKAVNALRWAVAEMERRYETLAAAGKRNLSEYNPTAANPLPYLVIVVDELADLMSVAQSDMEAVVVRLAQMARAVGIHLVLATQRPSVDILTGLIKANITARMAFSVASQVDSRTILDSSGAEQLLGNGDMLFVSAEQSKPKRIQGALVTESEVRKVVNFCKRQVGAVIYDDTVTERKNSGLVGTGGGGVFEDSNDDELLSEAEEEVIRAGKASASFLQRRLKIGYARAARLLDLLEAKGVIGPGEGAKPREVYVGTSSVNEDEGFGYEADETSKIDADTDSDNNSNIVS